MKNQGLSMVITMLLGCPLAAAAQSSGSTSQPQGAGSTPQTQTGSPSTSGSRDQEVKIRTTGR